MPTEDRRYWIWAVAVAATVLFAPLALHTPLLDPDEGLHAAIAQEMVERGDWVTPRLMGEAFLDKPILYFWAQAASLSLLGMHETAVRLPGVLFALLGAATTALLAAELFGRRTAWLAGIFHGTMVLPVALAQAAVHDVALVPWTNLALWSAWRATHDDAIGWRRGRWYVLAGLWLGLAILTKGLIGVALVGLAWAALVLVERRLSLGVVLWGAATLLVALLVAAPWYWAMEVRNPGYLYYYFVERHLLGYVTDSQRHGQRVWWYYLPILSGGALPWFVYLPASIREIVARRQQLPNQPSWPAWRFAALWLVSTLGFLTLANSKLLTYLLPAYPAVALLAAWAWQETLDRRISEPTRRLIGMALGGLSLVGPLILPITLRVCTRRFQAEFSPAIWGVAIAVSLGMSLPLVMWRRGRWQSTLVVQTAALAAILLVVTAVILPPIAERLSARDLARHVSRQVPRPGRLWIIEERIGSLIFYLDADYRRQLDPERIQFLSWERLRRLPEPQGGDLWLALPSKRFRRAEQYLDLARLSTEEVGHYRLCRADDLLACRWPRHRPGSRTADRRPAARVAPAK